MQQKLTQAKRTIKRINEAKLWFFGKHKQG
jgi:hypothetical protein